MKKTLLVVIIIGIIYLLLVASSPKKTKYIERDFKNGNHIEVEVEESLTSDNWDCIGDCSGHWAGYEWAEDRGIYDPEDCGGNSISFIEGCEAYANEN